jgi:hypothetical protein
LEVSTFDAACALWGSFFIGLLLVGWTSTWLQGQTPALTSISDTVYRADGTTAGGTLLISWPEFSAAAGQAVAAGNNSVALGAGGALSVQLVPNIGAIPSGTFYSVVYQLDDASTPPKYSRFSASLHVDYPLGLPSKTTRPLTQASKRW